MPEADVPRRAAPLEGRPCVREACRLGERALVPGVLIGGPRRRAILDAELSTLAKSDLCVVLQSHGRPILDAHLGPDTNDELGIVLQNHRGASLNLELCIGTNIHDCVLPDRDCRGFSDAKLRVLRKQHVSTFHDREICAARYG